MSTPIKKMCLGYHNLGSLHTEVLDEDLGLGSDLEDGLLDLYLKL